MVIAGLVMGILSVSVFFWAGPTIGGLWAASKAVTTSLSGGSAIPEVGPIWIVGLVVGVGLPVISLFLSIGGLMKGQSKGVGIAGIVTSGVGAILGLITTSGAAFAINVASMAKDNLANSVQPSDVQQMQSTLNDPNFQNRIQQAMDAAAGPNPNAGGGLGITGAGTPPASPVPSNDTLMPGQVPAGQVPVGQVPVGQVPVGQVPVGQVPGVLANGAVNPASPGTGGAALPAEAPPPGNQP